LDVPTPDAPVKTAAPVEARFAATTVTVSVVPRDTVETAVSINTKLPTTCDAVIPVGYVFGVIVTIVESEAAL
jgi:hypothetical protein